MEEPAFKNAEAVKNVASVVQNFGQGPLLVVISAMGKTTNKLEELVDAYYYNRENKKELFSDIKSFHQEITDSLFIAENDFYEVEKFINRIRMHYRKKTR